MRYDQGDPTERPVEKIGLPVEVIETSENQCPECGRSRVLEHFRMKDRFHGSKQSEGNEGSVSRRGPRNASMARQKRQLAADPQLGNDILARFHATDRVCLYNFPTSGDFP